jgi:hypothetical protein
MKRIIAGLAVIAALAIPATATASYAVAWENAGAKVYYAAAGPPGYGKEYAHWQCDVGGTTVAAAIWWVWLSPVSTAIGALAGIAFTVGCHVGAPDQATYMVGVPYERTLSCFRVYPHGSYAKRYTNCIV